MLAVRWGVTAEWISEVSRDPQRDMRYDDALHGLPDLHHFKRALRQREREVDAAVTSCRASHAARSRTAGQGYRYRGYLVLGAVVTVAVAFGSIAEEGTHAIVLQVEQRGQEEIYGVLFESGDYDWFAPEAVDRHLVATGLIDVAAADYRYRSAAALRNDAIEGRFNFWPECLVR